MSTVVVTRHATKRARQRFSIPKRSVKRQALNALSRGRVTDSLSYENSFTLTKSKTVGLETLIYDYDNGYYVFEPIGKVFTLITVLKIK